MLRTFENRRRKLVLKSIDEHCFLCCRDSLKLVGTRSIAAAWQEDTLKHQRLSTKVTHMDLTWLGCVLSLVDSHGQLYVFKVPPILEPGVGMTVNIASALLEYCLVTGTDNWDVLVSIQSTIVDAIVDRIIDNYNRQPAAAQQYYYARYVPLEHELRGFGLQGYNIPLCLTTGTYYATFHFYFPF